MPRHQDRPRRNQVEDEDFAEATLKELLDLADRHERDPNQILNHLWK